MIGDRNQDLYLGDEKNSFHLERKTTLELLNGRITEAHGHITVKYAKTTLNKVWLSEESVKEALAEIEHYIVNVQMSQEEWVEWKKTRLGLQEK